MVQTYYYHTEKLSYYPYSKSEYLKYEENQITFPNGYNYNSLRYSKNSEVRMLSPGWIQYYFDRIEVKSYDGYGNSHTAIVDAYLPKYIENAEVDFSQIEYKEYIFPLQKIILVKNGKQEVIDVSISIDVSFYEVDARLKGIAWWAKRDSKVRYDMTVSDISGPLKVVANCIKSNGGEQEMTFTFDKYQRRCSLETNRETTGKGWTSWFSSGSSGCKILKIIYKGAEHIPNNKTFKTVSNSGYLIC